MKKNSIEAKPGAAVLADANKEDNPFRFTNSVLDTKLRLDPEDVDQNYPPIFVNKALSQHADCILHVNAINCYYQQLSKTQQYEYFFHAIRKMRRKYEKWGKKVSNEAIDLVMQYHNYSYNKARSVVDLFSEEQLNAMRQELDIGG